MARNTKTETRNIALTVNGTTIVRPAAHLPGCKKAAAEARENGFTVSLKWTTEPETDLTAGLQTSGCCDDCECCGRFSGRHYWIETEWDDHGKTIFAWACPICVAVRAIHVLAAKGRR